MLAETGGISCPFPGFVQASSREAVTTVLADRRNFSSAGTLEIGNVRPMIPLQVDPPAHANYRKILDPLFAPKVMDAAEADLTRASTASSTSSPTGAGATSPMSSRSCSRPPSSSD